MAVALVTGAAIVVGCGSSFSTSDGEGDSSNEDAGAGGADGRGSGGNGGAGGSGAGGADGTGGANGGSGAGGDDRDGGDAGEASDAGNANEMDSGSPVITSPVSNVPLDDLDLGEAGDCTINEPDCIIDTDEGTISCLPRQTPPYDYAQVMQSEGGVYAGVFVCETFRVEASASARVRGALPLVVVALDTAEIIGELTADANGETAFGGGFATPRDFMRGGGPGGGAPGVASEKSGAGGGSYCGEGGPGGVDMMTNPGGDAFGTPEISPLLGGAGGGSASLLAFGGAGGGAIQVTAGQSISVALTGRISTGGGGGGPGSAGSGGGGSGGAILLEAPSVTVAGLLSANGGSGGGGTNVTEGADARPGNMPAPGGGDHGGDGSAGDTIDGSGASLLAAAGGGGAGRIRINTATGQATISGTVSPALETKCATQGTL